MLCWNLFSSSPTARYLAALVPLSLTLQFLAIGLGLLQDRAAVQAMTRHGHPRELLHGPLDYGLMFVLCTVLFWRQEPAGIVALMLLCGGDGLAELVGGWLGTHKLPFNPDKSWAGSAAMFLGGWAWGFGFLALFNALGNFQPALNLATTAAAVAGIALGATVVEALPWSKIDNITVTVAALLLGLWLL